MGTITAITLTLNEEKNISKCLKSITQLVDRMIVLDGRSSDNTVLIARDLGADIYINNLNYNDRFQFALDNCEIDTDWILFIDADERLTKESREEIKKLTNMHNADDVSGIVLKFKTNFLGKELKFGGSVFRKMSIFKNDLAFLENTELDQHIRIKQGRIIHLRSFSLHDDFKGIENWSQKHIKYARLAVNDLNLKHSKIEKVEFKGLPFKVKLKRFIKYFIFYKLPIGFRAKLYYYYRYYILLGFLDGKEGRIYIFLQAYWYRFLIDSIFYEEKLKQK